MIDFKVEEGKLVIKVDPNEDGEPVAINAILEQAAEDGLDKSQVEKAITLMIRSGKLFEPQPGRVQKI